MHYTGKFKHGCCGERKRGMKGLGLEGNKDGCHGGELVREGKEGRGEGD